MTNGIFVGGQAIVKRFRQMLGMKQEAFAMELGEEWNQRNSVNHGANFNYKCTFHPLDKWGQEIDENRRLYKRLLQETEPCPTGS